MSLPAMSGAEPWTGSYKPLFPSPIEAEGSMPIDPVSIAAGPAGPVGPDEGPVMVTIEYQIDPARTAEFAEAWRMQVAAHTAAKGSVRAAARRTVEIALKPEFRMRTILDRDAVQNAFVNVMQNAAAYHGGSEAAEGMEEERKIEEGFTYVWDQRSFDPASGDYRTAIHFRFKDGSELTLVLALAGVAHPTGYPLYTLWLRAWSWLPAASPATSRKAGWDAWRRSSSSTTTSSDACTASSTATASSSTA